MPKKLPFATIAEFIHSLGERGKTAKALAINPRTLTARLENPGTFTLAELQRVAEYGHTDLLTVTLLAEHQMKNPIEPPAPALGRPARQH